MKTKSFQLSKSEREGKFSFVSPDPVSHCCWKKGIAGWLADSSQRKLIAYMGMESA